MINFFLLAWDSTNSERAATAKQLIQKIHENSNHYCQVFQTDGVVAYAQAPTPRNTFHLKGKAGVILGRLFRKIQKPDESAAVHDISSNETVKITESRGDYLTDRFWGSYVSILPSQDKCLLIGRDCSGLQLCFTTWKRGVFIAFSNLDSLPFLESIDKEINWNYLSQTTVYGQSPLIETGLRHVEQLAAGQYTRIDLQTNKVEKFRSWRPEQFTEDLIEDFETAKRYLYDTVLSVVKAQSDDFNKIALMLSGGLDSSILLSILRKTHPAANIHAKHHDSVENDVSEKHFAQAMADAYDVKLDVEEDKAGTDNSYIHTMTPPWPLPVHRAYVDDNNESIQRFRHYNEQRNVESIFKGQGGDQIFFKRPQLAPLFDYRQKNALDLKYYSIMLNTARLTEMSVWKLMKIVRRNDVNAIKRPDMRNVLVSEAFVDRLAPSTAFDAHPWFQTNERLSFGKHNQLMQFTFFNTYAQRYTPSAPDLPQIPAFIAQPLMEAMLRIPTYLLLVKGRNRGLARETFKSELVSEVYNRERKGYFTKYFFNAIIENMAFMREFLYDGVLMKAHFLDRKALDANLNEDSIKTKLIGTDILNFLEYEKWARSLA